MEELEQEDIGFDLAFEIEAVIYRALEATISRSIDMEMQKDNTPAPIIAKEMMLKNILARNIDGLENEQYITNGPEGKVYLCGGWLMRPVFSDEKMLPMMEHIRSHIDTTNIIFCPEKTGIGLRKELWFAKNEAYSSYDLPKDCRIESDGAIAGGPTPSMIGMAGCPPPGMMGRPPMPNGMPPHA